MLPEEGSGGKHSPQGHNPVRRDDTPGQGPDPHRPARFQFRTFSSYFQAASRVMISTLREETAFTGVPEEKAR
jgi:hypothetical protein